MTRFKKLENMGCRCKQEKWKDEEKIKRKLILQQEIDK